MTMKLKLRELEKNVQRLTDEINTINDNLYLLMNFVDKTTVVVKFDPNTFPNLFIAASTSDFYPVYRIYYFLGDNIKCISINSLYSFASKDWNKQVPYRITRLDDKVIIIEFDYPKNIGTKTYLIDRIKGTVSDITLEFKLC